MNLCICNGIIVDPSQNLTEKGDIWIEDDKIVAVDFSGMGHGKHFHDEGTTVFQYIDADGKWVVPGLIDLHVHFRDPGYLYKEDIYSGSRAAARGGFTTVCCMPNTLPVIDNVETLMYVDRKGSEACGVNVLAVGAATKGQQGESLSDISEMVAAMTRCREMSGKGICAISEDGKTLMNSSLQLETMKKAASLGLPFFSHAEDENLKGSAIGEELIVARDLLLAREAGCKLHFCHISCLGSIELIKAAKAAGFHVTAETAPHYFTLDCEICGNDGNKKMNPPLRGRNDMEAIRSALASGILDAIATDHAPHHPDEKESGYDKALNGVIGLETSFAVSYTELVEKGILSPQQLIDKMSLTPAAILGIDRGSLRVGAAADIAILDVSEEYIIDRENFASKSRNSAFLGKKVKGRPEMTIVSGQIVWNSGRLEEKCQKEKMHD